MNPDTGELRRVEEKLRKLIDKDEPCQSRVFSDGGKTGEPPAGSEVPYDWPILTVGQELKQIKGWKLVIDSVDVDAQTVTARLVRR